MNMDRIGIGFFLALTFSVSPTQVAASQLDDKMVELARRVLALTRGQQVAVGVFSPTGLPDTNFGPGCSEALAAALEDQKPGSVNKRADFEVKGDYMFVKSQSEANKSLARVVSIDARVIDLAAGGKQLGKFPIRLELDHTKTIAKVIQETVALPANGTKEERNQILASAVKNPSVFLHGPQRSLVSSSRESKLAVEVLVRPSPHAPARPRSAKDLDGLAFVDIAVDEIYEIKLYNRYPREIAANVSVDGIDMFHFSQDRGDDGRPLYSHMIVPPLSEAVIVGWHHSVGGNENYKSFLVTSYGQGASAKSGIDAKGKIGVIHVQFGFTKVIPMGGRSAPGKETGFGPPRKVFQKPVQREFDPPHDFVSIRYAR
ncbi:hypothetical protein Enr13x_20780 [Stieleria neptunia]|uniref:Uncharacterized protein n=1 Tax=Stieleria neptunia TaxID=2527979 RepID=A0A518HN19_9BACT|nr:hypothetical protein [Stieleria neptunia]QDV42233.1 hypothetical protein Enr13x_20780 [Stieleria neptunia]